jgi:hypothetical protein
MRHPRWERACTNFQIHCLGEGDPPPPFFVSATLRPKGRGHLRRRTRLWLSLFRSRYGKELKVPQGAATRHIAGMRTLKQTNSELGCPLAIRSTSGAHCSHIGNCAPCTSTKASDRWVLERAESPASTIHDKGRLFRKLLFKP